MRTPKQTWIDRITQWQESDKNITDFCAEHQIAEATFYYWRKKMSVIDQKGSAVIFQQLQLPLQTQGNIEYIHPQGHRIIFHTAVSVDVLKQLIL
jgi:hypothetical protein